MAAGDESAGVPPAASEEAGAETSEAAQLASEAGGLPAGEQQDDAVADTELIQEGVLVPDETDVERAIAAIQANDSRWTSGEREAFGTVSWRPHLRRQEPPAVLHVHLAERLRPYMVDRMRAAFEAGCEVHIALPLATLYDEQVLVDLVRLDPQVHLIASDGAVASAVSLLTALAGRRIQVT